MCTTSSKSWPASRLVPAPPYDWAERRITSVEDDPQGRAHVDSFASVVKVWLFDDVGAGRGAPPYVVRGSHRHTVDRLAWEHARANGREALIEPSFRLAPVMSRMRGPRRPSWARASGTAPIVTIASRLWWWRTRRSCTLGAPGALGPCGGRGGCGETTAAGSCGGTHSGSWTR